MVRKKELIAQHQKSQQMAAVAAKSTSSSCVAEKPKIKKEVIKMTPAQLKEAERLGYVEDRGKGKVLTKAGLREFLPTLKKQNAAAAEAKREEACFKAVRRKSDSIIVLDDDQPGPSGGGAESTIEDISLLDSSAASANESGDVIEESIESVPDSVDDIEEIIPLEAISNKKDSSGVTAAAATVAALPSSKELQDQGQILAVPAESFGGPSNAFYLCTAGEDNNLTPINNEALYLDASNQLVPVAPAGDDKEQIEVEGAGGSAAATEVSNQSIILNTGDGQQIILDQQALMALASQGGDMPQIITQDGQQLILPGSAQEILAALVANQVSFFYSIFFFYCSLILKLRSFLKLTDQANVVVAALKILLCWPL